MASWDPTLLLTSTKLTSHRGEAQRQQLSPGELGGREAQWELGGLGPSVPTQWERTAPEKPA